MTFKMASAALLLAVAGASLTHAQDASAPATAPQTYIAAEAPEQYLARDRLITTKVKSPDGTIIGDIEDIILSGDHKVVGVVMGTGGFFGLWEKKVGVDINALQFDVNDGRIEATLPTYTKEGLEATAAFVRNQPKKSLFARAVEKGQEIRDKTGSSAKEAYEAAKENAGPAMQKAKDAAKEAMDKVAPALEQAKQKANEVIESAKTKATEAVEKAKEAAGQSAPASTSSEPAPAPATPAQ